MENVKVVQLKKPGGERYGAFRVVISSKKGFWKTHSVSTDTDNEELAKVAGAQILKEAEADPEAHLDRVSPSLRLYTGAGTTTRQPSTSSVDTGATTVATPTGAPEAPQINAAEVLGRWALGSDYEPPKPKEAPKEPQPEANKPNHAALAGLVSRLNVAAVGMSIRAFGRAPAEPSETEMQELAKAWEAQLAVWLANTTIEPWVMILGISCAMGLTMYTEGTPLPPKEPEAPRE